MATGKPLGVAVGLELRGRLLDGLGRPLEGQGLEGLDEYPLHGSPPPFAARRRVERALPTGLRAVDGLLTLGAGQSMALQSDAGVGKATTLGIMARNSAAHTVVIASIGERSTELRDFLERDLDEGRGRCVAVAATEDSSPGERVKAPYTAMAIAEFLRDCGQDVLLLIDNVPRWWAARRELGLTGGGLENLLARTGVWGKGTITTVLVTNLQPENDLRALTEGHVTLTKRVAHSGRYPAIDVTQSVSRRFTEITTRQHQEAAGWLRSLLVCHQENELLIEGGAYKAGFNPRVDTAIERHSDCRAFLMQNVFERADFEDTLGRLCRLKEG